MVHSLWRTVNVAVLIAPTALVVTMSAQSATQRGREVAGQPGTGRPQQRMGKSSPFVGTWVLNVAKSTSENVPPEARRNPSIRNIDVKADGTFSQSHRNKTGGGSEGYYHWHGTPGGPAEIIEYGRTNRRSARQQADDQSGQRPQVGRHVPESTEWAPPSRHMDSVA